MDNNFEISIDEIAKMIAEDQKGTWMVLPEKVELVETLFEELLNNVKGDDIEMCYDVNQPYISSGAISIRGEDIEIRSSNLIAMLMRAAANVEIYPLVDGRVQMDFTFYGLARKLWR